MDQSPTNKLSEALLLAYFDAKELAVLSREEIRLLIALRREELPELPDDQHRELKRMYQERVTSLLPELDRRRFPPAAPKRRKKKHHFRSKDGS